MGDCDGERGTRLVSSRENRIMSVSCITISRRVFGRWEIEIGKFFRYKQRFLYIYTLTALFPNVSHPIPSHPIPSSKYPTSPSSPCPSLQSRLKLNSHLPPHNNSLITHWCKNEVVLYVKSSFGFGSSAWGRKMLFFRWGFMAKKVLDMR